MDVSDFDRLRPARPKRPLGTFAVRAKPPVPDVGVAPPASPRRPAAAVDAHAPFLVAIASIDDSPAFGRMLPHLDEAYAALFGPDVWARHLQHSGSGAVAALGIEDPFERWRFDFAPQVPARRFDVGRGRLVEAKSVLRSRLPVELIGQANGPWDVGAFEVLDQAARSFSLTGDRLFAAPAARWRFESWVPTGPEGDVGVGLSRLIGLGISAPPLRQAIGGALIGDPAGEAFASFVETARHAIFAIRDFEWARRHLGYHIDEPYGARLASFAGGQLASFMYLCMARLPGFAAMVSEAQLAEAREEAELLGSDGPEGLLPGLVLGGRVPTDAGMAAFARPVLGPAALTVAFEALKGLVPEALEEYAACDLAAGIEHLRHLAFAHVAIRAKLAALHDLPMSPEMAFWIGGVDVDGDLPSAHGLVPMISDSGSYPRSIAAVEPQDLIATLRARRRDAGLDAAGRPSEASVAAAMTRAAGLRRLPAFVQPVGAAARAHAHAFKVGRARRILKEREAAGHTLPERVDVPARMPKLGSDLDEAVLRLVPVESCKPRVGPHPNPRGPYKLDEPEFMKLRRLRREKAAAEAKAAEEAAAAERTGSLVPDGAVH